MIVDAKVKDRMQVNSILDSVRSLTHKELMVGVPEDETLRQQGVLTNAYLAFIHENGAPAQNIPARPFLRPGMEAALPKVAEELTAAIKIPFSMGNFDMCLDRAGTLAVSSIQLVITSSVPPPLSPRTLEERKARGNQSTATLVDTGQMRRAITYVVRNS